MSKLISITAGIILAPFILYFLYSSTLMVLGYELSHSPEDLAEKLVKENRPAKDCFLFRTLDIGPRPSTSEMQMRCVRVYAELKEDPAACEVLLPSPYGISCMGAATKYPQQECIQKRQREILCYIPEKNIQSTYNIPQIEDCASYEKYNNHQVIHWCFGERARRYGELEQCLGDATKNIEKDNCYYQRAMKLDDLRPELCEEIKNNKLMHDDCAATVKAWIKYPGLKPKKERF